MAAALVVAAAVIPVTSAPACGCGMMIPSQGEADLGAGEWSIVRFDGETEAITMRLESTAAFDRAALLVPLPAAARFSLGHDAVFAEMAERTKPRVEHRTRHTFLEGEDDDEGAGGAAPDDAAIEVVDSQDLGPLRVVTLRGEDAALVETWLSDHGFEAPADVAEQIQPYLDRGWVVAAVRLRGASGGAVRELQPLIMEFPTRRAVLPMMGGEARVDVVAPYPVAVRDRSERERLFAGPMPNDRYLTSFTVGDDAEFVRTERDDFRQVRVVTQEVDVTGRVFAVAGAVVLLVAALLVALLRRRRAAQP